MKGMRASLCSVGGRKWMTSKESSTGKEVAGGGEREVVIFIREIKILILRVINVWQIGLDRDNGRGGKGFGFVQVLDLSLTPSIGWDASSSAPEKSQRVS